MPLKTKIVLSDKELALVKDPDWILTKVAITEKVYQLLNACIPAIDEHITAANSYSAEPPKIYKGENYRGLPYVTLDHPRLFNSDDIFAVRTMFWWGNFFSITLHVAGYYKEKFASKILNKWSELPQELFICVNQNQWEHHFETDNYTAVNNFSHEDAVMLSVDNSFMKIALKYNLENFNNILEDLNEGYEKIGRLLS